MRFAFLLLMLAGTGVPQQLEVSSATLSNGMKVLVHEDHNIPNVALYFFFKIGSRNERPGTTGLSHFFEHMMFNGARKYGPKQFDIQMEKNGGRNNAYTAQDVTVYTDWFPRTALELMFDMEADRIRDLAFDPKIVDSERGVVASERRNGEDSPFSSLNEQLTAAAFIAHPYHWPVVGWASDIQAWTMDDLKAHFRMGYAPNNCVMVASGDVDTKEVMMLAKRYLEPIPAHDPPPAVRTVEPEQQGERRVTLNKPAQLPLEMLAYHVPRSNSTDYYALEVLGNVLTQGRSSRMYRRLVDRDALALSVQQFRSLSLDPGLMQFIVRPRSGVDPATAEQAFVEEIERVRSGGISEEELRKAKNQLLAVHYRRLKTIAGKANLLGQYEVFFGDYRKLLSADKDLEKVTATEVQEAARRFLAPANKTVATLVPAKRRAGK